MTRRVFPENPLVVTAAAGGTALAGAGGLAIRVYTDDAATTLANIQTMAGAAIASSQLTIDSNSKIPLFKGPNDETDTLYVRAVAGGTISTIYGRVDDRLDTLESSSDRVLTGLLGPQSISGLSGWYDASQIAGLSDGGSVSSWSDSSGNGHTAAIAPGGEAPTYQTSEINSRPVVRFDGHVDHLRANGLTSVFTGTDSAVSVVAVLKFTDTAGYYTFLGLGRGASGTPGIYFRHDISSGGVYYAAKRDDANVLVTAASSAASTDTSWHVLSFVLPGTTIGAWEDGSAIIAAGTGFNVGATTLDLLAIGASIFGGTGDFYFKGDLAELCVYNKALSTTERQQLDWHFGQKYDLTVDTTGFAAANTLPLLGTYPGVADSDRIVVRENLTQAVIDAAAAEKRVLRLGAGTHNVPNALSLSPGTAIYGEVPDWTGALGTMVQGTTGQDVFVLAAPTGFGYEFRDLKINGGRRQISSSPTDYHSFVHIKNCQLSDPSDECIYLTSAHEELRIRDCDISAGTYGIRIVNSGGGVGGRYLDKSTISGVRFTGQSENNVRFETLLGNSVLFDQVIFNTADKHSVYIDGGFRGVVFNACNWEGGGQVGKNNRTTLVGTVSSGATSATLASGTGWATGDVMTIAGAGSSGVDLAKTVTVAGTAVSWTGGTGTTVADPAVTNAVYDDVHFANSIASSSEVVFLGSLVGHEGSGGHLRYAVHWPDMGSVVFVGSQTNVVPLYDPGKRARVIGGQVVTRRPGYVSTAGEDLWPVGVAPTVTGSRGANAALASLLTALATRGLIVDGSS